MYALGSRAGSTTAMNNLALLLEERRVECISEEASLMHPTIGGKDAQTSAMLI